VLERSTLVPGETWMGSITRNGPTKKKPIPRWRFGVPPVGLCQNNTTTRLVLLPLRPGSPCACSHRLNCFPRTLGLSQRHMLRTMTPASEPLGAGWSHRSHMPIPGTGISSGCIRPCWISHAPFCRIRWHPTAPPSSVYIYIYIYIYII
jgi:hypothetical protein